MKRSGNKKKDIKKLLSEEGLLRALIQRSIPIILIDRNNVVREGNVCALELFGYSEDEFVRLHRQHIFESDDVFLNETRHGTCVGIRKNGERFHCAFSNSVVENFQDEKLICISLIDISVFASKAHQGLSSLENEILEFYTNPETPIEETLTLLLNRIQQIHPQMLCTILKAKDGRLFTWVSPHLPNGFNDAIDGIVIAPGSGSCGTAAYTKRITVVTDILNDPLTENYKSLAEQFQLRSCWSHPILDTNQDVLGTFAIYYNTLHRLTQNEEQTIERAITIVKNVLVNKRAQDAVIKSEKVRRLIMNAALDAIICIDVQGSVTLWNPKAEKIFGWKEEEMLGKHMADFIIPESHRARHEEGFRHYLRTGEGPMLNKLFEINAINKNQREFPAAITILPVKQTDTEFFCAFIEDISEQRKAKVLLEKINAQLLSAQHIARLGYWELDLVTNSFYWSDEIFNICGMEKTSNNISIETFVELMHPDDKAEFLESYKLAVEGVPSLRPEYRIVLNDASIRYILIEATRVCNSDGEPIRLEGTLQDITKLKENEIALIELNAELNKRAEELSKSNADLEQFAYIASHDLQEPLRMVTSFLTQIEKKYNDLLDDKGKQYIFFAVDGATRMRRIILDLLEFSRVGRMDSSIDEINMNDLLGEVIQMHRTVIEEKGAVITTSDLPVIKFSKTAILQVMQNLISNALKYHAVDKAPKIDVTATEHAGYWKFSVRDQGIGIEPQSFDKIFVLFKRLHSKEVYSGTGLGLAICKRIIENYKGKIWVESIPGEGSTFYFTVSKQF